MRAQTIGVLIGLSLVVADAAPEVAAPRPGARSSAYESALRFFKSLPPGDIAGALRTVRPAALSAEGRAHALSALPAQGELIPTMDEVRRLSDLQSVLTFHDRSDALAIKIIDRPRAEAALYARSILLISRRALSLLSVEQLQGIVAHEMAHDFFWDAYYDARKRQDPGALREIELKCDGIATLTLRALNRNPRGVGTGLLALARYNEALAPINTTNYPDTQERVQFMEEVLALYELR